MTRYSFNICLVIINSLAATINFFVLVPSIDKYPLLAILSFIISILNLHYYSNLLHISSHQQLSPNRWLNHFLGIFCSLPLFIFTFIDFKITHLEHHKHPKHPTKDPDHQIVHSGHLLLLPFRILFLKDIFFIKFCLNRNKKVYLIQYLLQKAVQILIFGFLLTNFGTYFSYLYLLPLFLVGLGNGLFLYYYPHYQNSVELKLRQNSTKLVGLLGFPLLWLIDLSRQVHTEHHLQPFKNSCYFPEIYPLILLYKNIDTFNN